MNYQGKVAAGNTYFSFHFKVDDGISNIDLDVLVQTQNHLMVALMVMVLTLI